MAWKVYRSESTIFEVLALDKIMLDMAIKTKDSYLHIYTFSRPAICLGRSQSHKDVNFDHPEIKSGNMDVAARKTGGSAMMLNKNVVGYTIASPGVEFEGTMRDSFPNSVKDLPQIRGIYGMHGVYGERVANALKKVGMKDISIGKYFSVRAKGKVIAGHGQHLTSTIIEDKKENFGIYHGVIALNKWDADEIAEIIRITPQEKDLIRDLPSISDYIDLDPHKLEKELIRSITGDDIEPMSPAHLLEHASDELKLLTSQSWLTNRKFDGSAFDTTENKGFCFIDFNHPEPR